MPQKIKIQTGYSDKVSANFNSQQFSVSLELECSINGSTVEIQEAAKKLFALCRKIVSDQKGISVDNLLQQDDSMYPPRPASPVATAQSTVPASTPGQPSESTGGSISRPVTARQLSYIQRLGRTKAGLSEEQIKQLGQQYFGKSLQSITSGEASRLIDVLSGEQKKAA